MKDQASKGSVSLLITIAVVLIHLVVIGAIIWGCSSKREKEEAGKDSGAPEAPANANGAPVQGSGAETPVPPAPPKTRYRVPSANPNFGKPLDFSKADHSNMPLRLVPGLKEWKGTGIIVDMGTRQVLWEKDSHKSVAVASMVKMMTMLLVAEELERNEEFTLDTQVPITRSAMNTLPERSGLLWLDPVKNEVFTVRELLLGVAVKSANDAATQLAEKVGGTVDGFVARMNRRAGELGMKGTVFYNPCGLTDKQHRNSKSSAADMVILGERLLEYPFLMEMCSTKQASIRDGNTIFTTTNKLIAPHYPGVDGLKTGYIRAAGSCLTFSVLRNDRRIVGCVTGFDHAKDRDYFCRRLIDWAYDPQSINKPRPKSAPGKKPAVRKSAPAKKTNKKTRGK